MFCPVLKLTKQLIQNPSISPNDAGCQKIIINRLKHLGFTIKPINFNDTVNLWAWHGGDKGKTLAFVGHTDVVPSGDIKCWHYPPFQPTVHKGMLYGRGSSDMKGALAAMIIASERFVCQNPNHFGRIAFIITSDEESYAQDGTVKVVEYLMQYKEQIDYCLIGEPSSKDKIGDIIKNGRRGSLTAKLVIYGIQGHVAYPHLADNPIHRAILLLNELINTAWDKGNDFFSPTTMQITNIYSNTKINNMIPSEIEVTFNFRFNNELTDILIHQKVKNIIQHYNLRYKIDWHLAGNPFFNPKGKLINIVKDAIINYQGIIPILETTGGTSDGRFIAKMNTEILELGLTNNTIHKANECVKITDLELLSKIYQYIIEKTIL